jgi:hypothetical protein
MLKLKSKFKGGSTYLASSAENECSQPVINPGSTRGRYGVKLDSSLGQPGVNKGPTWGHYGVHMGSIWGQQGVSLGSTCTTLPWHASTVETVMNLSLPIFSFWNRFLILKTCSL